MKRVLKQVLLSQPPKMKIVELIKVAVCALSAGCGAPEQGALNQYMPLAGAAETSREGEGGQVDGGGKAVYCEVLVGLGCGAVAEQEEGSGFEERVEVLGGAGVAVASVDEAWVFMLVLEGLLAMADEERIGIGLSEGLLAIVLSVTVLLEDASLGVFPPRSSLLELILSSPLLPAAELAVLPARLRSSGLFMPWEWLCDLDLVSWLPTLPFLLSVLWLAKCPGVCVRFGAI